jgi:malonyl-CoA/methylmalonyl-CoA synthetase
MTDTISRTEPNAWMMAALSSNPDKIFIEVPGSAAYSFAAADELTLRMGVAMRNLGVVPGDRVAVQVEKSPEAFLLYLACLRTGAVFVPLNTAYTPAELSYFLADAEPRLFVVQPECQALLEPLARTAGVARVATLGVAADGSLMQAAKQAHRSPDLLFAGTSDALAALLYTSGTTGRSKGAMLTRRNLASNAAALVEAWRFEARDVVLHALPIYHAHGLFIAGNSALAAGATLRFLNRFDVDEVISQMANATVFMGVPTHYTRLLASPKLNAESTRAIRLFVSGSAPLLDETHRTFSQRTGHHIVERYAMTETLVNTSNPYDGDRRPGAVGFPLPAVEIQLTAPDSGEVLTGKEAVGMIEVRGPNLFAGYWRNPEKTAADIRASGFFITGDLGRFDADGYLHIVGRSKDLIISGGFNVYPIEIEAEIDAIAGVQECTVIGLPHPDFGEAVTAIVISRPGMELTEDQLAAGVKDKLARYKQPKRFLFADEFPRNALGKIQKNVLRDRYKDLYL